MFTENRQMISKLTLAIYAFGGFIFLGNAFAQQKEVRVALVIGNSTYKQAPLRNPANDARDMAAKLRSLGFTVIERSNLGIRQIGSTLREFRAKLTPGSVALVFYAGHGLQIKGENYLPAVDAEISGEEDVPNQSLAVRQIMDVLGDAKTRLNLVFLDACRDNPYARSFRSASRGLSKENAPSGTLISFATRPGSVASDGVGRNGLYTGALLAAMVEQNRPIEQVLKMVVTAVKAGSKNQQEPWTEGSIEGEFCFGECLATVASAVSITTPEKREDDYWVDVKTLGNREAFEGYLSKYPKGQYIALARAALARLPVAGTTMANASAQVRPVSVAPVKMGATFKDCDECPEMIAIPAGTFNMGSKADPFANQVDPPDELPQHTVSIREFSVGKYEVTQEQWFAVMGTNPSKLKGRNLPVEQVSWEEAQSFVKKLSERTGKKYRLPTEAEWEYAARAGTQTRYHFGDDVEQLGQYAWHTGNAINATHPVGEKLPNAFGLHDVHGNVWEWVEDCWHDSYKGAPTDGSAWSEKECSRWVMRGGSFVVYPQNLRSSFRGYLTFIARLDYMVGLRVARDN
jgi:formylglycine-generating enzyme required for sulfatase activity